MKDESVLDDSDSSALDKLKEILNPEDISFLRQKLRQEARRSPKSLSDSNDIAKLFNKAPIPREIIKRPRTILSKEEIDVIKSKSPNLSSNSAARLELLLKGLL